MQQFHRAVENYAWTYATREERKTAYYGRRSCDLERYSYIRQGIILFEASQVHCKPFYTKLPGLEQDISHHLYCELQ